MPETVAVLSDIHGVLPALEAVLAEPDVRAADAVVLTGDLAAGPLPDRTLDALTALGDRPLGAARPGRRGAAANGVRLRGGLRPHRGGVRLRGGGGVGGRIRVGTQLRGGRTRGLQ